GALFRPKNCRGPKSKYPRRQCRDRPGWDHSGDAVGFQDAIVDR
ncbi:MAG: hypothetical protein ACKVH1_16285, partial [Alphaproteobacteria bacterium]